MLVDSHCHLAHVEGDPERVVTDAAAEGVTTIVDIGMGTDESAAAVDRASRLDGVYVSVGIHPNDLGEFEADPDGSIARLRRIARRGTKVVGIGETGLDLYRERSSVGLQEDAFRAQIGLASDLDLALVIHCRDAHARVLGILGEQAPARVVMHCFSGDTAFARECAARGYYCSFAGNLTYSKSHALREAAACIPDELLLVETDAPYLTPHPLRGKPNSPRLVVHTAAALAELRGVPFDEMAARLCDNSQRAFRLALS